jgi:hypothetical protein
MTSILHSSRYRTSSELEGDGRVNALDATMPDLTLSEHGRQMGLLEQTDRGDRFALGSRCLLGRHPGCDVRVEDGRVSGEHASLHWIGGHWELRDLGSRNGTFVEGRRLAPGERLVLSVSQVFSLGSSGVEFRLLEGGPPVARARHLGTGLVRTAVGSLLVLPDDGSPEVSLFTEAGQWILELRDTRRSVVDQERIRLGQQEWVVELPCAARETMEDAAGLNLQDVHLRIGVSRDEEHVEVRVQCGGREHVLPSRTHQYLLATLARRWLAEHGQPEADRGWVDRDTLCRMLATDVNKLNVDIHRVRKQLGALGVEGAAGVVERRPGTGQVRIGVRSVEVFTL